MNKAVAIGAGLALVLAAAGGGFYFLVVKKGALPFAAPETTVDPDGVAEGAAATDLLGVDDAASDAVPTVGAAEGEDMLGDPHGAIQDLPPPAEGEIVDTESGDVFGDADKAAITDEEIMPPADEYAAKAAREVIDPPEQGAVAKAGAKVENALPASEPQ